jgi:hypothetical protein
MAYREPPKPGQRRIALVHAIPVSIEPINKAFATHWPEAWVFNLLEDSLIAGLTEAGGFTPLFNRRVTDLCRYCVDTGADAILFTGSAFGPAVDAAKAKTTIPVFKPYEAMIEAALAAGSRLGIVASFHGTFEPFKADVMAAAKKPIELFTEEATGALEALEAGDSATHDRLTAEAAARLPACDAIMLAQYSLARAAPLVKHPKVLTPPDAAVLHLKRLFDGS